MEAGMDGVNRPFPLSVLSVRMLNKSYEVKMFLNSCFNIMY